MHIDLVSPDQHESLIDLLSELHGYYNAGAIPQRDSIREHLAGNLLGPASPHRLVVASTDDAVLGLAAITLVYSLVEFTHDKRKHCQLKELYVRESARNQRIGHALMSWVGAYAIGNGCGRIDWPVKATNLRGIGFYQSLGAECVTERLSYRLSGPSLQALASSATPQVESRRSGHPLSD